LYFGSSERRLYGVYHPAGTARLSRGVVLCYPFGREYLRAHRAVRELANELSRSGFHGLRFDYFGCGDSEGEASEGTVEEWVSNVGTAVEELEEATGSRELSAAGLRLGATLAALSTAAPRARRLRSLALWDPIVVGARYLEELEALQRSWALDHPGFSATKDSSEAPEILGFPLTPGLRNALEGIDLRNLRLPAERILIVTGGEDRDAAELAEALARDGEVTRAVVPSSQFWLRQEGIDHAVVPTETVRAISSWFDGGAA
jgi:pimeloyl-ACP methyl ester carboxylesterase